MIQLLVISDDFTGALDTGVQFAGKGIRTKVFSRLPADESIWERLEAQVMVVDAQTRHLDAEEAYRRVYDLVKRARIAGVPYIYKKTDSGLRGNIGKELEAALAASGEKYLTFIPALPAMNRITVHGIHYVDGVPIHKTAFGRDPFEPVRSAEVKELFQTVAVKSVLYEESTHYERGGSEEIGIFDASNQVQIETITKDLMEQGRLGVMAGCAGFASVLGDCLGLETTQRRMPAVTDKLLIVCGSVNEITGRQVEYAQKNGMKRITVMPEQQFTPGYLHLSEGREWLQGLKRDCEAGITCVVETGISEMDKMAQYRKENHIPLEQARVTISKMLGEMLKELLEMGLEAAIMIIGGDTLAGFMTQMHCEEITVYRELEQGTVLSSVEINGKEQWLISKSGGFGEPELLVEVDELIRKDFSAAVV